MLVLKQLSSHVVLKSDLADNQICIVMQNNLAAVSNLMGIFTSLDYIIINNIVPV